MEPQWSGGLAIGRDALAQDLTGVHAARLVERLERRRSNVTRRTLRRVGATAEDERALLYARGAAATTVIEQLSHTPVRLQVHPDVQRVALAAADDVGRALESLREVLDDVAEQAEDPHPDDLAELFERTEIELAAVDVSERSWTLNRNAVREVHGDARRHGLRAVCRRESDRLNKLRDLSARMARAGRTTALESADPALRMEVTESRRHWGDDTEKHPYTALQVLGIIGCGLGIVVSGVFVIAGINCAFSCGSPSTVLLAVLGAVVIAACVAGIIAIVRRHQNGPPDAASARGLPKLDLPIPPLLGG